MAKLTVGMRVFCKDDRKIVEGTITSINDGVILVDWPSIGVWSSREKPEKLAMNRSDLVKRRRF